MRQFIRHPTAIPIEVNIDDQSGHDTGPLRNVSLGGLAFAYGHALEPGMLVEILIPAVQPVFKTRVQVVWCGASEHGFELGVEFLDPGDSFTARMVEQICHIEDYRQAVHREEGRQLSAEQAAAEWIVKYAAHFPAIGPEDVH